MSGTIGFLTLELSRYTYFTYSIAAIKKPADTYVMSSAGKGALTRFRNTIDGQNFLARQMVGDWLWILGDDHEFGEDSLINLLSYDADIVVPVNIGRQMPFGPLVWDEQGREADWSIYDGKQGLVDVPACGNAGMLIRRRVFEKLPQPWFEWAPKGSPYHGSDLAFCWKARQAGFRVCVDTETRFGHTTVATFTPVRLPDSRFAAMMTVQGQQVALFRFQPGQKPTLFEQKGVRG